MGKGDKKTSNNFHDSGFVLRGPDMNKIPCKDCTFRAEDRLDGAIKGAALALCEVFPSKPLDILFKGLECPYYVKED